MLIRFKNSAFRRISSSIKRLTPNILNTKDLSVVILHRDCRRFNSFTCGDYRPHLLDDETRRLIRLIVFEVLRLSIYLFVRYIPLHTEIRTFAKINDDIIGASMLGERDGYVVR